MQILVLFTAHSYRPNHRVNWTFIFCVSFLVEIIGLILESSIMALFIKIELSTWIYLTCSDYHHGMTDCVPRDQQKQMVNRFRPSQKWGMTGPDNITRIIISLMADSLYHFKHIANLIYHHLSMSITPFINSPMQMKAALSLKFWVYEEHDVKFPTLF